MKILLLLTVMSFQTHKTFVTQIKVFLIKYESFLTLHRQQSKMFKAQKCSKGIVKMVHGTEFHFWVN